MVGEVKMCERVNTNSLAAIHYMIYTNPKISCIPSHHTREHRPERFMVRIVQPYTVSKLTTVSSVVVFPKTYPRLITQADH
jgi:hypothetical protein